MNRSIFFNWTSKNFIMKNLKCYNINFGPQHPATHGVLRLLLQLNNEVIENLDIHIGYLHRGTEKLFESKNYLQNLPYFDRFDYMTMYSHEHVYCLNIESNFNLLSFSSNLSIIRTFFDEIARILNHIIALSCHALDIGSMTPIFWIFEEREKLLELCENMTGARMHPAFHKFLNFNNNNFNLLNINKLLFFIQNFFITLNEIHNVLTYNKIWKQRLINIGTSSINDCINYSLTGIMSRAIGIKRDLRISKNETYGNYYYLNFKNFIGNHGDSYDRYLIRINEISESLYLITQLINKIIFLKTNFSPINNNFNLYNKMEFIINHFKFWSTNVYLKKNFSYSAVESPKGELGITLISNNSKKPFKCKLRSPGFFHLQYLQKIANGMNLADLITLIGSIDIVFGEIDK